MPCRSRFWGEPGHRRRVDRRDRGGEGVLRTRSASHCSAPVHERIEIEAVVDKFAEIAIILQDADPHHKQRSSAESA